jgi:O-antigen/teichoic acid export membrane protein
VARSPSPRRATKKGLEPTTATRPPEQDHTPDVAFGVSWLSVANLATKVLWAGSIVVLTRGLGPAGYGELAAIWAYAALAAGVTDLGAGQVLFRAGSRRPEVLAAYFAAAVRLKTILTFFTWVGVVATCALLLERGAHSPAAWFLLIVLASGVQLLESYPGLFVRAVQLLGRMDLHAKLRTLALGASLIGFWIVVATGGKTLAVSVVYFAITIVLALVYGWTTRRLLRESARNSVEAPSYRSLAWEGAPFVTMALLNLAYGRVDTVLLAVLDSPEAAGVYNAQYQLILLLYSIPGILLTILMPGLYRARDDKPYLERSFRRVGRYLNLIAWLVTPMLFFCADSIMHILGGSAFAESSASLRVLALMVPLYVFTAALEFLVAIDRIAWRIGCETCALVITFLGGSLVISHFSTTGMAVVAVLAFFVSGSLALGVLVGTKTLSIRGLLRDAVHTSVLVAPALAVFYFSGLPWWVRCGLFAASALGSLTLFRFWDDGDRAALDRFVALLRPTRQAA